MEERQLGIKTIMSYFNRTKFTFDSMALSKYSDIDRWIDILPQFWGSQ